MESTHKSLLELPEEVLDSILHFVDLQGLVASECTCQHLKDIARSSHVWREHSLNEYRFWHPQHHIKEQLARPVADTDWRQLLTRRKLAEIALRNQFEALISSQLDRVTRAESIVSHGYDAKDFLWRQLDTPEDASDYLSKTWWAKTMLQQIERDVAAQTWLEVRRGGNICLERALACADLMLMYRAPETLEQLDEHLDRIAAAFVRFLAGMNQTQAAPRQKALLLGAFLRQHRLIGDGTPSTQREYHRLQNILITAVLCSDEHCSLQLPVAAIYCALARRVGLRAHLVNYPMHIHVVVTTRKDAIVNLDGEQPPANSDRSDVSKPEFAMYLDVYRTVAEVPYAQLYAGLMRMGLPEDTRLASLTPSVDFTPMLIRTANNLDHTTEATESDHTTILEETDNASDFIPPSVLTIDGNVRSVEIGGSEPCLVVSNLLRVMFTTAAEAAASQVVRLIISILHGQALSYQTARNSLAPLFNEESGRRQLFIEAVNNFEIEQNRPPTPKPRTNLGSSNPAFPVGTYFQHRRYDYYAVIIGWDTRCDHSNEWIQQMGVDALPRGRHQPFYSSLDHGASPRYVAEENIRPVGPDETGVSSTPNPNIMRIAGQYFKRWDKGLAKFVNNMPEEYPDN